jgi:hypothetical protein
MYIGITFFSPISFKFIYTKVKGKERVKEKHGCTGKHFFLRNLLFVRTGLKFLIISWKNLFESERQVVQRIRI